jgi:hypothetical protein
MSYVICVCLRIAMPKAYCVVFLLCFPSSMLPVSLDCPFCISPSVFSNVYLQTHLLFTSLAYCLN